MLILLVIIGLMAGIALASYLFERRQAASRTSRPGRPSDVSDDVTSSEDFTHDFDAEGEGD